ncbi:ABC transporter substrate-binding protein [Anderseniella sp. Alg231-50]|uniref:ABC transporter substrate-binding protein n=1 Tax=Anderseniella sp. Alg231-50 TaxID=1922226 RepID=UPI003FCC95BD
MFVKRFRRLSWFAGLLALTQLTAVAAAADKIAIGYLQTVEKGRLTISVLDQPPKNLGLAGAEVGINDNNTTGRFVGQEFTLDDVRLSPDEDLIPALDKLYEQGVRFFVLDVSADNVLKAADHFDAGDVVIFNAGARDNRLRDEDCRSNVIHTAPSRAILADGLAQYLIWKKWRDWFLVFGSNPADKAWAASLRRAATRYGARIVSEKEYVDTGGARQTDSGHAQVQKQMPVFSQDAEDHDVVVVADESEVFGTYLPYRTWLPRPVTGSAGLQPVSWHPAFEGWGAAQIQNRFAKHAGRRMLGIDMQAWTAIRMVGEAATRTKSADPAKIDAYIKDPGFSIAAFKGQKITLRDWNLQLRQPVLLADGKNVVSVSPQSGFLHQFSELDTLGHDKPETSCKLNK